MRKLSSLYLLVSILLAGIFISCKKERSCEGCPGNNRPPISIAGPDQVITLPTDSISLDGSASSDPDGTISEWLWNPASGGTGPASFYIVNAASSKTIVRNLDTGVYRFELIVTDNGGLIAKDTLQIMVVDLNINRPPVTNAGPDQTITLPTNSVNLDGSASTDPDNNITTYTWTKISGPSQFNIANANEVQTQVIFFAVGVYRFELNVTDKAGLIARDTMQVTVNPANHPPVANAGVDQTITLPANTTELNGSASQDPDNNITTYQWTKISGPASFNITNAYAVQTQVANLVEGIYQFELKVTDAGGLYDKDTVLVTVTDNTPEPGVYIAGSYASSGVEIPFYYENGIRTDLGNNGRATSIFVSGTDVYVAGNNNGYPCYWKNGVKIDLPTTGSGGDANSILVYGTDVYVAGNVYVAGSNKDYPYYPCYWKNGARIDLNLTGSYYGGIANSIFVSGTDVYVDGKAYWSRGSEDYTDGYYWKNGVMTDGQVFDRSISFIFVSGADLYVLYQTGFTNNYSVYHTSYIKNGVITNLPDSYTIRGYASSMFVSGTDVYVSGNYYGGPCYWKNGARTDLSRIGSGGTSSILVYGTDVYVAGSNNNYPCYWKNGVRRDFSNITNGWFSSIFVKR